MQKIVLGMVLVVCMAVGAYAQSFWQTSTIRPAFASADLTCYAVDPGYELASVTSRSDVLATLTKRGAQNQVSQVCFLRVPSANPEWGTEGWPLGVPPRQ